MRRTALFAVAATLAVALPASPASAQWGWGGWGGGVGTVPGSIARGMGYYNMGAGLYNLDSAQAASINTDTVMRWNQFMFQSQMEANRREYLRMEHIQRRDSAAGEAILKRLRENPNDGDLRNGNALNVILDQVTDPRIHSSALRMANDSIPSDTVASVPFFHASDAVTINLHQLTAKNSWPIALKDPAFDEERAAYQDAINQALKEDTEGEISLGTLQRVKAAAERLRLKFRANPPQDRELRMPAENYLRALVGMTRMLEKPEVEKVLAELKKFKATSLGSLLSFMHFYDLRFGVADTPQAEQTYRRLYPVMAKFRDRVLAEIDTDDAKGAQASKGNPTDIFRPLNLDDNGKPAPK